jgi:hypothetical protein
VKFFEWLARSKQAVAALPVNSARSRRSPPLELSPRRPGFRRTSDIESTVRAFASTPEAEIPLDEQIGAGAPKEDTRE